jgi:amino acid transporter/nucleotide-binding universal stress UspA family protein
MEQEARSSKGALALLVSERPRNVTWLGAAGLLFGDWGTSRLYVLGLAFLVAGRSSFYLIAAMSLLLLCVAWAYTQICRLYPDGGGVYTAGKHRARIIGVIGALLLFADYTVTASLSSLEAFHYFGLSTAQTVQKVDVPPADAGDEFRLPGQDTEHAPTQEKLWNVRSPALWGIVAIGMIGALNLLGPKHSSKMAIVVAGAMVAMTVLLAVATLPRLDWSAIEWGRPKDSNWWDIWQSFVFIVLALSGVEAISNLTGVMKKPVYKTARKAIWIVAIEVTVINIAIALCMIAYSPGRAEHAEDMLAYIAGQSLGPWGEIPIRVLGGLLLLSATNTAINGLMSICYVMSRDGELPAALQKLNGLGTPWIAALIATAVPITVLLFFHDLAALASLYAIGVVGAVALNCLLCSTHPRLRRWYRKVPAFALGALMLVIWVTLAWTKPHATVFVSIVLLVGLALRAVTQWNVRRHPRPSLLRQAIIEQLPADAWTRPRILLATAGSAALAEAAVRHAKAENAALVVSFVREVALNFRAGVDERMSIDTDHVAQEMFADFLELSQRHGVPVIPSYDVGPDAAVLIAEAAAINGAQEVLIGSSRRGKLHQIIRGSFQRKLETLLPREIPVRVLDPVAQSA